MQPLCEMLGHPNGIGHRRQRRVHGADADEEAGVDDVQIVELVSFAVDVEDRGLRIGAEAAGAGLMSHARDRDVGLQVRVAWNQMVRVHAQVTEHRLQLLVEPLLRHLIVRRVTQRELPVSVHADSIVRIGQVLRREPEVDGVSCDVIQQSERRELGLERFLAFVHLAHRLADHLDIAHRKLEPVHAEIEVVQRNGLLKERQVRLL